MKEQNKRFYNKNWFGLVVIPLTLLAVWIGLTFLYILTFDTSLTVISSNHSKDSFERITYKKLLKGDKVSGSFTATDNNLGIVSVKFQTFIRPPYKDEDHLLFRLKEKGADNWYYTNKYRDGFIYEIPLFPFGFPKIPDSKDRTYYFEIESLNGNENNSVALSKKGQVLFSKYQVPKSMLMHDKKEFLIFLYKKFASSMLSTDVRFSSFIYLLPFIFYMLWLSPFKKKALIPASKYVNRAIIKLSQSYPYKLLVPILRFMRHAILHEMDSLIIGVVLIDIFLIQLNNDMIYVVIAALWIVTLMGYKLPSKRTFTFALLLLLLPPLLLSLRDGPTAEKSAIWAYVFLVAGTIQILIELRQEKLNEKA